MSTQSASPRVPTARQRSRLAARRSTARRPPCLTQARGHRIASVRLSVGFHALRDRAGIGASMDNPNITSNRHGSSQTPACASVVETAIAAVWRGFRIQQPRYVFHLPSRVSIQHVFRVDIFFTFFQVALVARCRTSKHGLAAGRSVVRNNPRRCVESTKPRTSVPLAHRPMPGTRQAAEGKKRCGTGRVRR